MSKVRYNIIVRSSQNGRPKRTFAWNIQPVRPAAVEAEFLDAVRQQWDHLTFEGKYASACRGLDFRGNMEPNGKGEIENAGTVWMWGLGTALVIGVERV